jgi:hypothetical membrane protein
MGNGDHQKSSPATPGEMKWRWIMAACGLGGVLLLAGAALAAAWVYVGTRGEPYRVFNHFISELGELGVSSRAWVFNGALIIAGPCFAVFSGLLGFSMKGNALAKAGMVFGILAGIFCALIGLYPIPAVKAHFFVAVMFFRCALISIFLFSLAIYRQAPSRRFLPNGAGHVGLVAVLCFVVFLFVAPHLPGPSIKAVFSPGGNGLRPPYWPLAIAEWSIFISTGAWFLTISLMLLRTRKKTG